MHLRLVISILFLLPLPTYATNKPCVTAEQASKMPNKDVCVSAHIYDVVELPDGTRYLDICSPDTPDEKCIFTLMSFNEDREAVGELLKYRSEDVHVRGIVRPDAWTRRNDHQPFAPIYGGPGSPSLIRASCMASKEAATARPYMTPTFRRRAAPAAL